MKLFLTCEHGGNQVPEAYKELFKDNEEILNTHRGYDKGALELFKTLLQINEVYFSIYNETTRLLVDCNRSLFRLNLFSEFTKNLDDSEKNKLLDCYYFPYRKTINENIKEAVIQNITVFHISVHCFAPEVNGKVRDADIGILFDPNHGNEKKIAMYWKRILNELFPTLKIRLNYPFIGKPDGVVAPLRKEFGKKYLGFEIEVNSKHAGNVKINTEIKKSIEMLKKQIEFYYASTL